MASEWEDTNRPVGKGLQIGHEPPENIRKKIYLTTVGIYATADKAERLPHTIGDEVDQRFAAAWENILFDYPSSDLTYDTSGGFPTEEDFALKLPGVRPGDLICWFDRSFSHSLAGVVKTGSDYEFKFEATSITKDGIYNDNTTPVDIDGTQETWNIEEDDFRPGTPFTITGAYEPDNDGFYRVRSVRSEGSSVYVIADDNEYNQQILVESGPGGTADCNFPGDWYTLRGGNGNSLEANNTDGGKMNDYFDELADAAYEASVRDLWWTPKDQYHRYEKTGGEVTFGPNDGRPPTGGLASKDFNGDWVRCPNPSRYHTYDVNAHRWFIKSETDGSQPPDPGGTYIQYTTLIQAADFLSFQPDPREQRPPFRFADTDSTAWKYNEKVKFKDELITDPANMGAIQAVTRTGYVTGGSTYVGKSNHSQYQSHYTVARTGGNTTVLGDTPPVAGQSYKTSWINSKFNNSIQNACEMAIGNVGWHLAPDDDYKVNWISLFTHLPILMIDTSGWSAWNSGTTYGDGAEVKVSLQVYVSIQAGNLNHNVSDESWWRKYTVGEAYADSGDDLDIAWQPNLNFAQPFFALMSDEIWGENGSAFELALKMIGSYDWYYDDSYAFRSDRAMDDAWEWVTLQGFSYPSTHNGVSCNSDSDVMDAYWKVPVGTWRRTWKYSLGKPRSAAMKDGDLADPTFEDYNSTGAAYPADYVNESGKYGLFGGVLDDMKMFGHHRMTAPPAITDDPTIASRHERTYEVNAHNIFAENLSNILTDCWAVLDLLEFKSDTIDLSFLEKLVFSDNGATDASFDDLVDHLESYNEANQPAISTYTSPAGTVIVGQKYNYDLDGSDHRVSNTFVNYVALKLTKHTDSQIDLGGANGNGRTFFAVLSAYCLNDHYDSNGDLFDDFPVPTTNTQTNQTPGLAGVAEIACLSNDELYYGLAELETEGAEISWNAGTGEYEYKFKLKDLNGFMPRPQRPYTIYVVSINNSQAILGLETSDEVVVSFDWDEFDGLWDRDWERGDYKLVDFLN